MVQVSDSNPPITVATLLTPTPSPTGGASVGGSSASLGGSKKSASKSSPSKSPPQHLSQELKKQIIKVNRKRNRNRKGKGKGPARFTPSLTSLKGDYYRDGSTGGDGSKDAGYLEEEKDVRQHRHEDVMEQVQEGEASEEEEEDEDYKTEESEESEESEEDEVEEEDEDEDEEDEDEEEVEEVVVVEMEVEEEEEDDEENLCDYPYNIYIPTYKRCATFIAKTQALLLRYGLVPKAKVCVQNLEDEEKYRADCHSDLEIISTPPGLLETVNFIASTLPIGERIVIMHDDVECFEKMQPPSMDSGASLVPVSNLDGVFQQVYNALDKHQCHLAGFYPVRNSAFMAAQPGLTTDLRFLYDPVIVMVNQGIQLSKEMAMKQDYERCILYYNHAGKVLRFNHYAFLSKYNPKGDEGGIGHRDADSDSRSTREFERKYPGYIKNTKTHKDGSTSFVLNPNAERQRLAALSPKDAVPPRPQRPNLEMPDVDSQVHAVGISGCSSREGRERQYEEWTALRQSRRAQARAQVQHRSKSARFDEEVAQLVASSSSVYDSVKRRRR
jgi:hypothetical protein